MQQAIFTNGKVNGVPTLLLVDTGSAVTIIHRRLWEQGQASTLQKVDGGPIVAANGQSLFILGQVKSHLLLAGGEFIYDVLVADDVSQDCLLSADFLTAHGFIIDFNSRMLCKGTCQHLWSHHTIQHEKCAGCPLVSQWLSGLVRRGYSLQRLMVFPILSLQLESSNLRKVLRCGINFCWPELWRSQTME